MPIPNLLPQFRNPPAWINEEVFPVLRMKTAISVGTEFWSILRSYSEIRDRGKSLIKTKNINKDVILEIWKRFRAYVRQAENYWNAARNTSYKSSSLLYYYSFMNLVKAKLILDDHNLPHKVYHGLSFDTNIKSTSLRRQKLRVNIGQNHLFSLFYKSLFDRNPPKELNIQHILAYTEDIGAQYEEGDFGKIKVFPFVQRIAIDSEKKIAWLMLALPKSCQPLLYKNVFKSFCEHFELTDFSNINTFQLTRIFDLPSTQVRFFDYYQSCESKKIDLSDKNVGVDPRKILQNLLTPWIAPSYYTEEFSGVFSLPQTTTNLYPFNDEIGIYIVMFYMSEIVRYRPDILDALLETKPSWLLESFVESCPLKFLRAITFRIVGHVFQISQY